ncbi:MAG TPA: hypothetical protein VEK57_17370, partial [Thermoanaerobaculia bacterium]|nr:hypothetical protein [Thermoanaerobaculia bacterium]
LLAAVPVVVLNARTGESYGGVFDANPTATIRIAVEPFALRDKLLVGFPAGDAVDPAQCSVFFLLEVSADMMLSGAALAHPTELAGALRDAISAGIDTRVLGWHSFEHALGDLVFITPGVMAAVGASVNGLHGQGILDQTGRRESSVHHQKGSFVRTALPLQDAEGNLREYGGVMAFLGGIDPRKDRYDSDPHPEIDPDRPNQKSWHDIHCRVRGKAAWDVYRNYRQRWNAGLENPDLITSFGEPTLIPTAEPADEGDPEVTLDQGPHTVQINRTIAPHLEEYAPYVNTQTGDLSVLKSYQRIIDEARQFLYIEDQYFWSRDIAQRIHDALFENRIEFVMLLLPKRLNEAPLLDLMLYAQRRRALSIVLYGVPEVPPGTDLDTLPENVADRVVVFTIRNDHHIPIYVHCKSMIADDLWMNISSSNFSRRSLTYDSEIGAAAIDSRMRRGGGLTPRQFRVDLLADHLRLLPEEKPLVEDPRDAFRLMKAILAGEFPGRKFGIEEAGIAAMDIAHTHLGTQPSELDGGFIDAVNLAVDPDGRIPGPNLIVDLRNFLAALAGSTDTVTFGGIGTLRLVFDVSSLGDPDDIQIRVEITVPPEHPTDPEDIPELLALGPFPANTPARIGLVRIGVEYLLSVTPEATANPGTPLAPAITRPFTPAAFTSEEAFIW